MKNRLSGKVALVTGGSKGIGRAVALAYAREGASVFICARNEAALSLSVKEIASAGGRVKAAAGDIGSPDDARRIVRNARDEFGRIDILVNNAGLVGPRSSIQDYPFDEWQEVLRVNLTGVFVMTQETLKVMVPQRAGSIINVSSGVGRVGRARWGAYAVSKFGVEGLTQVLADEVREYGIRVNTLNPGPTRTEMRASAYPTEDPLTLPAPDQITGGFIYLASDESSDVTGQALEARDWL